MRQLPPIEPVSGLELIAGSLPAWISSSAALSAVHDVVRDAPAAFNWHMLETRPGLDAGEIDFLAGLIPTPGARASTLACGATLERHPTTSSCAELVRRWASNHPSLTGIQVIWFEWDAPFDRKTPFVLPFIDPRFCGPADVTAAPLSDQLLMITSAAALLYVPLPARRLELAQRYIRKFAEFGNVLGCFPLLGRGRSEFRLYGSAPPSRLLPLLAELRWPGSISAVERWLPAIVKPWEQIYVQLEFDEEFTDYLGLEAAQTSGRPSEMRARRDTLLASAQAGLLGADKVDGILRWVGRRSIMLESAPASLNRSLHLKHTFGRRGILSMKTYFGWCVERSSTPDQLDVHPHW